MKSVDPTTLNTVDPVMLELKGGVALIQALGFLEDEAAKLGYGEVSHLIGCAKEALVDRIGPRAGDRRH